MLGVQNGGLDSEKVRHLMEEYLQECSIPVEIYEYDPQASDDLIGKLRHILTSNTPEELQKITGFSSATLSMLFNILQKQPPYSLIQLQKVKGLDEETIKTCFRIAMQ